MQMTIYTKCAFQGNPDLKLSCIHGMKQLIKAKKLSQDRTWDLKGYAEAVQTPYPLAELIRSMFIHLPEEEAYVWAVEHLEAIPVGADLSNIWAEFVHWLVFNSENGIMNYLHDEELRSIYQELVIAVSGNNYQQLEIISDQCSNFIMGLNIDNDPANQLLYLVCVAKSIAERNTYHLIENLNSYHEVMRKDPEEARKRLQTADELNFLEDFEPAEAKIFLKQIKSDHILKEEEPYQDRELMHTITVQLLHQFRQTATKII